MADADSLLADLYRLPPEEQTRFLLIVLTGLDDSDQALLKTYQEALDDSKTDPYDKEAYYAALDLRQRQDSVGKSSENLDGPPENVFDFDLFADEKIPGSNARQQRRVSMNFARRLPPTNRGQ